MLLNKLVIAIKPRQILISTEHSRTHAYVRWSHACIYIHTHTRQETYLPDTGEILPREWFQGTYPARQKLVCRTEFIAWHLSHPKIGNADGTKHFCIAQAWVSIVRSFPQWNNSTSNLTLGEVWWLLHTHTHIYTHTHTHTYTHTYTHIYIYIYVYIYEKEIYLYFLIYYFFQIYIYIYIYIYI